MTKWLWVCILSVVLACSADIFPSHVQASQKQRLWEALEPGLFKIEVRVDELTRIVVLRFDPAFFLFDLYAISDTRTAARTLDQWAKTHDLVAAINASMYLPDSKTSTGYMRRKNHVNNPRMGNKLRTFFVAQPKNFARPLATFIEKDSPHYMQQLQEYDIVIQNYRMIDAQGNVLWDEEGASASIAAVGEDAQGHILLIHCREPISGYAFAKALLPLQLRHLMYVEGGAQAGLILQTPALRHFWMGRHKIDFLGSGSINAVLPNIIGVTRIPSAVREILP